MLVALSMMGSVGPRDDEPTNGRSWVIADDRPNPSGHPDSQGLFLAARARES